MRRKLLAYIALTTLLIFFTAAGLVLSSKTQQDRDLETLVQRYSSAFELDPHLTLAVIHTESRGCSRAVSSAGAMGLMQLMPATAREVAQKLGLPPPSRQDLFDPETNIHLGTAYLRRMLDEFDQDPYLSLAAYNAGPGAVRRWRRTHPGLPPSRLVQSKAYPQTRVYVKRVMRKWKEIAQDRSERGKPSF
jgi:soluble lytic murein transglycosylase